MSLFRPIMRARIAYASRPLLHQLRAKSTTNTVARYVPNQMAHQAKSHLSNDCPCGAYQQGYLKDPITGKPLLPDHRFSSALDAYYTSHHQVPVSKLPDYSGADSEDNYKVHMSSSLEKQISEKRESIINLIAQDATPKRAVRRMLGECSLADLDDVHEQCLEYVERKEKKKKEKKVEHRYRVAALVHGSLLGCSLGLLILYTTVWVMGSEQEGIGESDVD